MDMHTRLYHRSTKKVSHKKKKLKVYSTFSFFCPQEFYRIRSIFSISSFVQDVPAYRAFS